MPKLVKRDQGNIPPLWNAVFAALFLWSLFSGPQLRVNHLNQPVELWISEEFWTLDNIFVSSNGLISVFFFLPLTILIYGIARTLSVRLILSKNQGALRYHTLIDQLWRPQLTGYLEPWLSVGERAWRE